MHVSFSHHFEIVAYRFLSLDDGEEMKKNTFWIRSHTCTLFLLHKISNTYERKKNTRWKKKLEAIASAHTHHSKVFHEDSSFLLFFYSLFAFILPPPLLLLPSLRLVIRLLLLLLSSLPFSFHPNKKHDINNNNNRCAWKKHVIKRLPHKMLWKCVAHVHTYH